MNRITQIERENHMSEFFLGMATDEEMEYQGFFDGQQDLIPDDTELECVVIDGFNGIEEGKAVQVCFVQVAITTSGPFLGYKYKYNAKIYEMDATKRDKALKNLQLLDTQAGSPLGKGKLPLSTENMQEHWVGASHARIKMGVMPASEEDLAKGFKDRNFIRGFGFLRSKLPQPVTERAQGEVAAQQVKEEPEIDF